MASTPQESKLLSVHRTFVVQLHAGVGESRYSGRVEHVASGRVMQFSTLAALLEFLADGSGAQKPGPHAGAN